jgi:hypothetical protein
MIGARLEGNVERELYPKLVGACDEFLEVFERAELGVDRLVPTFLRANGPRTAGIVPAPGGARR